MPSACGQSDPNRIRSTGMCSASSGTLSSTNGATQQFSWNWSTGFFENMPGFCPCSTCSLWSRSPTHVPPFSM